MKNLTISVFGNQIFSEILKELKLFSDVKIKHYDDLLLCKKEAENKGHLLIYFESLKKQNNDKILNKNNFPLMDQHLSRQLMSVPLSQWEDEK